MKKLINKLQEKKWLKCDDCNGRGKEYNKNIHTRTEAWSNCPTCKGTGHKDIEITLKV